MKLYLNDCGMLSAAGNDKKEILNRLMAGDRSGLDITDKYTPGKAVVVGEVNDDLYDIPNKYRVYDCRNNQLLLSAFDQIEDTVNKMVRQYGRERIGVIIGTSTSGVRNTELAIESVARLNKKPDTFHYKQQQLSGGADFLAHYLDLKGPVYAISTACSSSGKAFASARRLIALDLCDAVIVGGADSLCRFTVNGFMALESVSKGYCKPFGAHRDGINLSEAASLFVLSKEEGPVLLQGIGASSDAYHFSAPDPEAGAVVNALQAALDDAQISPGDIDYINLHGTATRLNDAMESKAVHQVFGNQVAVSSTKGMTGHALGAAAALELGVCWMILTQSEGQRKLPPNINEDEMDQALAELNFVIKSQSSDTRINRCQSNSFAFGGNNISIIISRT